MITLKEQERIDDLERNGYRIIQNKSRFCFGMDAVLLSGFAAESEKQRTYRLKNQGLKILDLGTGTGIIPLLLHARLSPFSKADGICIRALEIQPEVADMARRSMELNHLEESISVVEGDIKQASELFGRDCFDVVSCNPPYKKQGNGLYNPDDSKAISRHEILCSFEDVAREAAAVLKTQGRFYLVHRPERLTELMGSLKRYQLEPKRLRMVHSFADSGATMVLIEASKGGGAFLKVERPLIIYESPGVYTREIRELYAY